MDQHKQALAQTLYEPRDTPSTDSSILPPAPRSSLKDSQKILPVQQNQISKTRHLSGKEKEAYYGLFVRILNGLSTATNAHSFVNDILDSATESEAILFLKSMYERWNQDTDSLNEEQWNIILREFKKTKNQRAFKKQSEISVNPKRSLVKRTPISEALKDAFIGSIYQKDNFKDAEDLSLEAVSHSIPTFNRSLRLFTISSR